MGSTSSVNPGVADVLQILSSAGSASLSSALSSPSVESALDSASPGDIVHLSKQALQLQEAGILFGSPAASQTAVYSGTGATAAESAASEEVSALLGSSPSAGNGPVSFVG
jgi:hypothetical protein